MYVQGIVKAGDNEVKEITSEAQQANLLVVTLLNYSLLSLLFVSQSWPMNGQGIDEPGLGKHKRRG